jgi:hypothetical protein
VQLRSVLHAPLRVLSGLRISSFGFGALGIRFRVSDIGFRVSRIVFRVSGSRFRGFRVLGCRFRASGFGFQVSGFGVLSASIRDTVRAPYNTTSGRECV